MEFVMLIGMPGSGIGSFLRRYEAEGYRVCPPDNLRETIANASADSALTDCLKRGDSCVADGTRLSRRKRMTLLRALANIGCTEKCLLVLSSPAECKRHIPERDKPSGEAKLDKLLRSFECPYDYEGWDSIEAEYSGEPYAFPFDRAMTFPQDNPHHVMTLGEHMAAAENRCRERGCPEIVIEAARYHDIGKYYTKDFHNTKGEPTEAAHFYGHDGYGAYLYLCEAASRGELTGEAWRRALTVACLISWHMMPLNAWRYSAASQEKHRRWMGEDLYRMLLQVHEADASAH